MTQAVVVSFDRMPVRLWGCYGPVEVPTPHGNRIASRTVVFDRHYADDLSPEPDGHAWWSGRHESPVLSALEGSGVAVRGLTTDDPRPLVPLPEGVGFELAGADDVRLLEHALGRLEDSAGSRLLWVKGRGVPDPVELDRWQDWRLSDDARRLFDGVATGDSAEAAVATWSAEDWATWRRLCGEEFGRADAALGRLWDRLESAGRGLFAVTAGRGGRLGERVGVAPAWAPLAEELAHVPLLMHDFERPRAGRSAALTQSGDLSATLLDWFGVSAEVAGRSLLPDLRGEPVPPRDRITWGTRDGAFAVRTDEFCLTSQPGRDERQVHLFVKPDDRWEVHDVAAQEPETTARLAEWGNQNRA